MENIIKIEELRIGNYICVNNNGHPCRVMELTMSSVVVESIKENYNEPTIKSFNPIPLTEEWLFKFGFEVSEIFKNSYILNSVEIYIQDGLYWYDFGNDRVEVKTIHQLQNIYFALNDKELTMK